MYDGSNGKQSNVWETIELHYKVKILEETKGWFNGKKETVVLVAYKAIASLLDLNPDDYPNEEEFAALKFQSTSVAPLKTLSISNVTMKDNSE